MKVKLKKDKRMPRLKVIPGLDVKKYRGLQSGREEDVNGKIAEFLLQGGWIEELKTKTVKSEKKEVSE